MPKHWSEVIVKDIWGALSVFIASAFAIYIALIIAKALYPPFPLDNTSSGIVAVIFGLFSIFIKYVKGRNSH